MSQDEFETLIADGLLTPKLTAAWLRRWASTQRGDSAAQTIRLPRYLFAGLRFVKKPTLADVDCLERGLDVLSKEVGATVVRHTGEVKGRARWQNQIDGFVRARVRERVRQAIRSRRRTSSTQEKWPYGFAEEEVTVDSSRTEEDLRSTLSCLGCDSEDYPKFLADALKRYPMPPADLPDEDQLPEQARAEEIKDAFSADRGPKSWSRVQDRDLQGGVEE